ncbi:hypothetical protein E3V36_05010 [Candidatus Marinimicrobia bacterium MT.SAG.2]|nr:hypothetical protein E3V36_05010 [Candidatus Marinimicrobia bacterium MT.SAG.2]
MIYPKIKLISLNYLMKQIILSLGESGLVSKELLLSADTVIGGDPGCHEKFPSINQPDIGLAGRGVPKELLRRILAKPKDGVCQKLMIIVIACPTDARRARSESTKPQRDSYGTIS